MSREARPIINAWHEESKKRPEGGKEFTDAMDKRIAAIKKQSIEEKKRGSHSHRAYLYFWSGVETQEEFDKMCNEALGEYKNGNFFAEKMVRFREVDAKLSITLGYLRAQWIEEYDIKTVPEFILLDMALNGFFHYIRLNEAVNNIMANIEWQMFESEAPVFLSRDKWGMRPYGVGSDKAVAEGLAHRLNEVLLPTLDQYNRMFIRNLKAIRDLKRGNIQLNIGNVGQMNIGDKQVNVENSP